MPRKGPAPRRDLVADPNFRRPERMREFLARYEADGAYESKSFEECEAELYSRRDTMDDYLWGVYVTNRVSDDELKRKCLVYEQLMRAIYQAYVPTYAISYDALGDQEAFSLKYTWELSIYFGFFVFPFINDFLTAISLGAFSTAGSSSSQELRAW